MKSEVMGLHSVKIVGLKLSQFVLLGNFAYTESYVSSNWQLSIKEDFLSSSRLFSR